MEEKLCYFWCPEWLNEIVSFSKLAFMVKIMLCFKENGQCVRFFCLFHFSLSKQRDEMQTRAGISPGT